MSENLGSVYTEFRLALQGLQADVAEVKGLMKEAENEVKQASEEAGKEAKRNYEEIGKTMKTAGKGITAFGGTVAAGLGWAVKGAMDYEKQMSTVGAISGATGKDMDLLKKTARDLGATTAWSATEAAQGMEYLALAGWDANQMADAMPGVLNLASAGNLDLARAADIVTDTMSAFGMEAKEAGRASDVFAKAQASSNTNVEQLGEAFKYVAPSAKAAGMNIEQTTAILGVFADNGIKGSSAGTTLDAMFRDLKNSVEDGKIAIGDTSVAVYDANGMMRDMGAIMEDVEKATADMNDEQRDAALGSIFQSQAMRGLNVLLGEGSEKLQGLEGALYDSEGAAKEMADAMLDNLAGAFTKLMSAVSEVRLQIGEVLLPILTKIVEKITEWVGWLGNLDSRLVTFITIAAAVAAAIALIVGPLLIIIGTALPGLITMFGFISGTVLPAVAAAFWPVTLAVGAIIAIAVLLYNAWKHNLGGIQEFTAEAWNWVIEKFHEVKNFIMPIITELVAYILERWEAIQPVVGKVMDFLSTVVSYVLPFIWDTVKFYLEAVLGVFQGVFNFIAGLIKFFVALFTGDWAGMWEAVKQMLSGAVQAIFNLFKLWIVGRVAGLISGFVTKAIGFFARFASSVTSRIAGFVSSLVSRITSGMSSFVSRIASGITTAISNFVRFVNRIPTMLGNVVSKVVTQGKNIVRGIWNGISGMAGWLKGKVMDFAKNAIPGPIASVLGIASPSRLMKQYGNWTGEGLEQGITDTSSDVERAAEDLAKLVSGGVKSNIDMGEYADMTTMDTKQVTEQRVVQGQGTTVNNNYNAPLVDFRGSVRSEDDVKKVSHSLHKRISNKLKSQGEVVLG